MIRNVTSRVDRHQNTILNGYNDDQFLKVSQFYIKEGNKYSTKKFVDSKHDSFRNRLDFLLGHYLVSRGENKRYATLPDLGIVDCPSKEGPTKMKAVVLIMNQGISEI